MLSLLAGQLNLNVLQALDREPTPLADLRRAVGNPPVTTMRSYLRELTELGPIERQRESEFPSSVSYAITRSGRELLAVGEVLQHWLHAAPDGPIELGSVAAKSATKALLDGWSSNLIRVLAGHPFALTELSQIIPQINYPTLERRLTAMRQAGLIEPDLQNGGKLTRYQASPWLRYAVAPVLAGIRWEHLWAQDQMAGVGRFDVEAAFLLAVPLLELSTAVSGTCRLVVEFRGDAGLEIAGVMVTVAAGSVSACVSRLEGRSDAAASGTIFDWVRWFSDIDGHQVEMAGDTSLAHALAEGLRDALVSGAGVQTQPRPA